MHFTFLIHLVAGLGWLRPMLQDVNHQPAPVHVCLKESISAGHAVGFCSGSTHVDLLSRPVNLRQRFAKQEDSGFSSECLEFGGQQCPSMAVQMLNFFHHCFSLLNLCFCLCFLQNCFNNTESRPRASSWPFERTRGTQRTHMAEFYPFYQTCYQTCL